MNWIADILSGLATKAGRKVRGGGTRKMRDAALEGAAYVESGAAFHDANMVQLAVVIPVQAQPEPAACPFTHVDNLTKGARYE